MMLLCLVVHWPVVRQSLEPITACHVLFQLNVHGSAGSMRRKDIQLFRISSCLVHGLVVGRKLLWFIHDADCPLGRRLWAGFLWRAVVIVDIDVWFVWIKLYQWWLLRASISCTFLGKTILCWCTFCLCLTKTAWIFFTSVAMFPIIFPSWCRW